MSSHPNRSKRNLNKPGRSPTPEEILAVRVAEGLTQTEIAEILFTSFNSWQRWEYGQRTMHPVFWAYLLDQLSKIKENDKISPVFTEDQFAPTPIEIYKLVRAALKLTREQTLDIVHNGAEQIERDIENEIVTPQFKHLPESYCRGIATEGYAVTKNRILHWAKTHDDLPKKRINTLMNWQELRAFLLGLREPKDFE